MTTKTKLFTSAMAGAPVLNGVAGSMISLLDSVAVSGFGTTSVVSLTIASGIATATFSAGHSFIMGSVANVTGANPSGLNGDKRILTAAANSVTFSATGIADQTAGGAIVAKVAPLGFAKSFAGANLASYKMTDPEGTGFYLRVDDTGAGAARVRGYEAMTDVNTGEGLFPSLSQVAAPGQYVSKSATADATPRPWFVVGDSRGFYLFVNNFGAASAFQSYYFGDALALKSNDPYCCILRANVSDQSQGTTALADDLGYADGTLTGAGMYAARPPTTVGGALRICSAPVLAMGLPLLHVTGSVGWPYPSLTDNGLLLSPVVLASPTYGQRGYLPGLYASPQIVNDAFASGALVPGTGAMVGKSVIAVKIGAAAAGAGQAVLFIDPITDWR